MLSYHNLIGGLPLETKPAKKLRSKVLNDREMANSERKLQSKSSNSQKRRSKILYDQDAARFEEEMRRQSYVRQLLREWSSE